MTMWLEYFSIDYNYVYVSWASSFFVCSTCSYAKEIYLPNQLFIISQPDVANYH